ncbi:MAG: glutamate-5-semialdehyde dehydrogenase [Clostridiales bacterium]
MEMANIAKLAKNSSIELSNFDSNKKNTILDNIAKEIEKNINLILKVNSEDIEQSKKDGLSMPLLKRLSFNEEKIKTVIQGIKNLIELDDPVGKTKLSTELDKGLELYQVTCPIGLIGVIFESRPDALVQISTLCLKSGNSVILKGGREATKTNKLLTEIIKNASIKSGAPENWIFNLETREDVHSLLKLDKYIDLIIPRGSNEFVKFIMDNSKIPVLGHADGICHCYIDEFADINMALDITDDSKTQYVAVCNALETLLVNEKIAKDFLPKLNEKLTNKNVKLIGCEKTQKIISCEKASDNDWSTEYLDYILSIKIISNIDEAIEHINNYGSGHTDSIVTSDKSSASRFMNYVDSGNVFWNCSTRFSDGFVYGLGAEVGISTNKIHSRGPVGLEGLIIYKYKLIGTGQIIKDYSNKNFTHKKLNKTIDF